MALSYVRVPADGTTSQFSVPFPYLLAANLDVRVDGAPAAFSMPSTGVVLLSASAPSLAGKTVTIRRKTPIGAPQAVFAQTGIAAKDMNRNASQGIYLVQEITESALSLGDDLGSYDTKGKRVANVAPPVADNDAIPKAWAQAANQDVLRQAIAAYTTDNLESGLITNLEKFGATPDPTTHSPAINAALAFAASRGRGARVILLPIWTWAMSGIVVPAGTSLEGQPGTKAKRPNNAPAVSVVSLGSQSQLRRLDIDGNAANQTNEAFGILGYRANDVLVEDVSFSDHIGIIFGASECQSWTYRRAKAYRAGGEQQGFWNDYFTPGYENGYHLYEDCVAYQCELDGLSIGQHGCRVVRGDYSYNGTVSPVPISGALGSAGIYIVESHVVNGTIIEKAVCTGNTEYGINGCTSYLASLLENRCSLNGLSGISLGPNSSRLTVRGNYCWNNGNNPTTANQGIGMDFWLKAGIQFDRLTLSAIVENHCWDDRGTPTQEFGLQVARNGVSSFNKIVGNSLLYNKTNRDNFDPTVYPGSAAYFPTNNTYRDNA